MMHEFSSPAALAEALADAVAAALAARLARTGAAALAVSGGTTPVRLLQALSAKSIDWPHVSVTLVDERWVAESSTRSNAALVKNHLLQGAAAQAAFLPLVNGAATPEAGLAEVERAIAALPLPFAAVVLGMGLDGHTASFFPGGDRLAEALAPSHGQRVESMRAEAAVEPRITLTLPVLLQADFVALHIEGAAKRDLLEHGAVELPVRAVLARNPAPAIFWSP
ncbi:6-phosphogluconolactonase [Acidocella sp.]|uniref:6-phosphogluconolactonase n=1 Tax=Acidocella sp. TaxID=50710 RepID=UPI00261984F1|nr:6-phosphogluconolactonase [Acidocella sp.]MDD2795627.1 6-phosphogluconolactonase [Acidocella sp.]